MHGGAALTHANSSAPTRTNTLAGGGGASGTLASVRAAPRGHDGVSAPPLRRGKLAFPLGFVTFWSEGKLEAADAADLVCCLGPNDKFKARGVLLQIKLFFLVFFSGQPSCLPGIAKAGGGVQMCGN